MAVSTGGRRFVLSIAVLGAVMIVMLVRGPAAVAFHIVPPTPSYVTEFSVPGSAEGAIANGIDDSIWVPGRNGAANQIVKIDAGTPATQTPYDVPLRAEGLAVAGGSVWASATERLTPLSPPTAKIVQLDPAPVPPVVTPYTVAANTVLDDMVAGPEPEPDTSIWFIERNLGPPESFQIGKIDAAGVVTHYAMGNRIPTHLASGPSADGNLWFLENVQGIIKVASLDLVTETVTKEYELGVVGPAPTTSPIHGPDSALWFIEILITGQPSITKMPITGALEGTFERHTLSSTLPQSLTADTDGFLWFTTGGFGNVGRMAPDGQVTSLLCAGPGHPDEISPGPGANVTFTQFEDKVVSMPVDATGDPCPVPVAPGGGGSGGGGGTTKRNPPVARDKTPAKISLSAKATQRLTKKGTIVVSVMCSEDCAATAQARVSARAGKVFRSQTARKELTAGKRAQLTLKFKKGAVKVLRRALRRKKRLKANITVTTDDGYGNASTAKRSIKLKR